MHDFAIIGAGISGLTAAYLAKKSGANFIIFNPGDSVGGCINSKTTGDFQLECGANTFASNSDIDTLIKELNLEDRIAYPAVPKFKQYIWNHLRQKPSSLPKTPTQLLFSDLFSWPEKIKIITGIFKKISPTPGTTVSALFNQIFCDEIVHKSIQPALRGIFGGDSDLLLAEKTLPKIYSALADNQSIFSYMSRAKSGRKIFIIKGGNQLLAEELFKKIGPENLVVNKVSEISFAEGSYTITTETKTYTAKKIIIALSGASTSSIIKNLRPNLSEKLKNLPYSPIAALHFSVSKSYQFLKNGFGMLFPFSSHSSIIGVLCNSTLFPDVSKDKQLITVCLGGKYQEHLVKLPETTLIEICKTELAKYLKIKDVIHLNTTIWDHAIPQFTAETFDLEDEFKAAEKAFPGLFFVGVDRGKIGVPDRISYVYDAMKSIL